jgi:hypothetical protein
VGGNPDLIGDHHHHENKVDAERPEDQEFGAFEVAAGNGVLFGVGELIVFERGENPGLVERGDGGRCRLCFSHRAKVSRKSNFIDGDEKPSSFARLDSRGRLSPHGYLGGLGLMPMFLPGRRRCWGR